MFTGELGPRWPGNTMSSTTTTRRSSLFGGFSSCSRIASFAIFFSEETPKHRLVVEV